tara:strand:- start:408 stop:779 length:372 start_codon:yes stop_codon:yes gene_type:complete
MAKFSKQTQNFLKSVGADPAMDVSIVPKSDSCASPGDVLFFRYKLGIGAGSRAERLFLVTEPITREAATGNLLLTGFRIPGGGDYSPDSLETLYKNKELPEENYRTYIMSNIYGPLRRIRKIA